MIPRQWAGTEHHTLIRQDCSQAAKGFLTQLGCTTLPVVSLPRLGSRFSSFFGREGRG